MRKRIKIVIFVLCFLWVAPAIAQDYPKGPIQLVVPFAPGGSTDIFWRSLGDILGKHMKATIAIMNKTGGGGVVGVSAVINSKPDGYTLLGGNSDPLSISPVFTPDIPYDVEKDLTFIAKLAVFPQLITVRTESPFRSLEDLVAFARVNPKKLKAGLPGVATAGYFGLEMLNRDAKIDIVPIPFGGGGELLPNLLGGHVDLGFTSVAPIKSQLLAGKVRILAFLSTSRLPDYPQIPTAAEKGYRRAIIATGVGLVGPKGLPLGIVGKWEDVTETTMKDPNVISTVQKLDFVIDFKPGQEFKNEILREIAGFKEIVPKSGVQK